MIGMWKNIDGFVRDLGSEINILVQKDQKPDCSLLQLNISKRKKTRRKTITGNQRTPKPKTIAFGDIQCPSFLKQGGHLREPTHM